MINEIDIQLRMLISEIHSLQNENTHLKGMMSDCVPLAVLRHRLIEMDNNVIERGT